MNWKFWKRRKKTRYISFDSVDIPKGSTINEAYLEIIMGEELPQMKEITEVIQEIIESPEWVPGNTIVIGYAPWWRRLWWKLTKRYDDNEE